METVSLKQLSKESKIELLKQLDLSTDGIFVLKKDGEKYLDKSTKEPIKLDNMLVLPGSIEVIDNNPVSLVDYFDEHGDII